MTPRIIVGMAALLSGSVCGLLSTFMTFKMVDKVNENCQKQRSSRTSGGISTSAKDLIVNTEDSIPMDGFYFGCAS
jgi:hypothetical protein